MSVNGEVAEAILRICKEKDLKVVTAESCTGGLIAAALTEIAGSSSAFNRGFITYSNEAKVEMLGVRPETLEQHGAVSQQTAHEMAEGAIARSHADIAVSVTGIAGPDGGSEEKPVGLVWFGLAQKGAATKTERHIFEGDRGEVRKSAVSTALKLVAEAARG